MPLPLPNKGPGMTSLVFLISLSVLSYQTQIITVPASQGHFMTQQPWASGLLVSSRGCQPT